MDTDVVVVGAGPVGLMATLELRRHGIDVRIIDKLAQRPNYAKAVGVQPRTLELWAVSGIVRPMLDAAITLRGQLMYRNGEEVGRIELHLPDDVPYGFVALPQNETERILEQELRSYGTEVMTGVELISLAQKDDAVHSELRAEDGTEFTLHSRYVIGCDGAHSTVRKELGADFSGDAFPEGYMLADVELDWNMPAGYGVRAIHETGGETDDVLVCIPLPGHKRYRVSMLVAPDLEPPADQHLEHGLQEGGRRPQLRHVQAVLDRLAPEPATAANLRWSSVFRISHRLTDRYGDGRVFLAGDAAHIHPPTGAQGMNTGLQDAINLAWKLALTVTGAAAPGLLETYHEERYPVGAEVVGRTVRDAREGIGAGETDPARIMAREAQLLVNYRDSRLVREDAAGGFAAGPAPGDRAPDATGLRQSAVQFPIRLYELLQHTGHTVLLWADSADAARAQHDLAAELRQRLGRQVRCYLVQSDRPDDGATLGDADGRFAAAYGIGELARTVHVVRPDGYLGYRSGEPTIGHLTAYFGRTLDLTPRG